VSALRAWITRDVARATAVQKWVALERFAQALGKIGMVPEFATLWPVEGGTKKAGRRRVTVVSLGQEQYTQLLETFGAGEEVYWALRLEREVGLTREEALMTNLVVAAKRSNEAVQVSKDGGQQARPIELDTDLKRKVFEGAREFVVQCGREKLCWRRTSTAAAVKRVGNAVTYQLRVMRASGEM
jgi:hypothetical protein